MIYLYAVCRINLLVSHGVVSLITKEYIMPIIFLSFFMKKVGLTDPPDKNDFPIQESSSHTHPFGQQDR